MNDLTFVVSAFVLGALHALEPGHGKTVVAAYLVGSKGRIQDAFALGGIVTFTHTFSIILLGALTAVAAAYFVPETVHEVLEVVSGLLIVVVGLWMIKDRLLRARAGGHSHSPASHHHSHTSSDHDHPSSAPSHYHHEHPRGYFHAHLFPRAQLALATVEAHPHGALTHSHPAAFETSHHHSVEETHLEEAHLDEGHHHEHEEADHGQSHTLPAGERPSLGSLITLGISGGIVPCPAALALLLAAVSTKNLVGGVSLVIVFSVGLAAALIAIGVAMVQAAGVAGRILSQNLSATDRLARYVSVASALIVTLLGVLMAVRAVVDVTGGRLPLV